MGNVGLAMPPVLYLDIDGVLWDFRRPWDGIDAAADGIEEFIELVWPRFEVRWLTYWAPRGTMSDDALARLAGCTGIPSSVWRQVAPSQPFSGTKATGITWPEHREGRPFVWLDDDPSPADHALLESNGCETSWIPVDVLADPKALVHATELIRTVVLPELRGLTS